jgi:hypothetical protein
MKEYREGNNEAEAEDGVEDSFEDAVTGEQVSAISAILLVLTPRGVELLTDIKGIKVDRQATYHDVVMMTSVAKAEAEATISSRYTADAMLKSMRSVQKAAAGRRASRNVGGVPIIGGGRRDH